MCDGARGLECSRVTRRTSQRKLRWALPLVIAVAAVVLVGLSVAPPNPQGVESVYVQRVYPRLLELTVPLSEKTSWSITEVMLAALLIVALLGILRAIMHRRRAQW